MKLAGFSWRSSATTPSVIINRSGQVRMGWAIIVIGHDTDGNFHTDPGRPADAS